MRVPGEPATNRFTGHWTQNQEVSVETLGGHVFSSLLDSSSNCQVHPREPTRLCMRVRQFVRLPSSLPAKEEEDALRNPPPLTPGR